MSYRIKKTLSGWNRWLKKIKRSWITERRDCPKLKTYRHVRVNWGVTGTPKEKTALIIN
jgi:hypothetical protein